VFYGAHGTSVNAGSVVVSALAFAAANFAESGRVPLGHAMTITGGFAHSAGVPVTVTNTDSADAAFAPIQFREKSRVAPHRAITMRLGTPGGRGSDRLTLSGSSSPD
jgi:hypothetical protein